MEYLDCVFLPHGAYNVIIIKGDPLKIFSVDCHVLCLTFRVVVGFWAVVGLLNLHDMREPSKASLGGR